MNTALNTLRQISYFSEIDEQLQQELAQYARLITIESDEMLLMEGDVSEAVYVVESGWLKSSKSSPNGREHVLQFIGAGESFNELSILIETINPTTITALERSTLYVIQRHAILDLLDKHPGLARIIIQRLAGTVQFLLTMIEDLSLRSIDARLARYLLDQASDNTLHRPKWATQAEIANHLGTVPNVLNRSLKNLEQEKLIKVERHQIKILDLVALAERASLDK
jgi:CRP-like cAMP-binding protein